MKYEHSEKNRSKRSRLYTVVLLTSALFAFSSANVLHAKESKKKPGKSDEKPIVLKWSTAATPETTLVKSITEASTLINEKSKGRLDVQVFHSGQLSAQFSEPLDILQGQIDVAETGFSDLSQYYKPISVLDAPYLFRDSAHMYKAMRSDTVKQLFVELEKASGIKILDIWYYGARSVSSNKKASTPEEFKNIKIRMPNLPIYFETARILGANPTPLPFGEIYLALKTGTVDAQDNPPAVVIEAKFYEVQKYIILTNHMEQSSVFIMSKQRWDSLSKDLQRAVLDGFEIARKSYDEKVAKGASEALKILEDKGLEILKPDLAVFRARAKEILAKYEDEWGPGLYSKIQNIK